MRIRIFEEQIRIFGRIRIIRIFGSQHDLGERIKHAQVCVYLRWSSFFFLFRFDLNQTPQCTVTTDSMEVPVCWRHLNGFLIIVITHPDLILS